MKFELFISFNGNCREAMEFYAKVFKSEVLDVMKYSDAPADPSEPMDPADADKIMYAHVLIGDKNIMFCDMPSSIPAVVGNNFVPTINVESQEEVMRIFNELKEGGESYMEPQKIFFSECYGHVKDRFGIIWNIMQH